MAVKKDKNTGTWYFVLELGKDANGNRKQKRKRGFKTKKEAEAAFAETQDMLNKGTYIEPSKVTYKEFIGEWLKTKKINIGPQTFEIYQIIVNTHIIPFLGGLSLQNIKTIHIQNLVNDLVEKGYASDSVRKIHAVIRNTLEYASEDLKLIPINPAKKIVLPKKKSSTEITVWNEDQLKAFLGVAKHERTYNIFVLAIFTGMRQGELLGLSWKDVDLDGRTLKVTQTLKGDAKEIMKGAKSKTSIRTIPLNEFSINALKEQKRLQEKEKNEIGIAYNQENLVFCSEVGTPIHRSNLRRVYNRLIKEANVPKIRFHDLRHSHATYLLSKGVNIKVISERLGHSDIKITLNTYSHVGESMQKEVIEKLDHLIN
ncbi:tyrosine-type recombinase/integrase [Neobacillus niacini]|uniref:site-specific integrase n=1 Tax=Neobacillus niacini TaxID=86668 RepID=UPI003983D90B